VSPIISLDKQELQAIVILKRTPEFKQFIGVLTRELNTVSIKNATIKDDVHMRWNQGHAQILLEILTKIKTADEDLHAFNTVARTTNVD
jgi:hypothetical protein